MRLTGVVRLVGARRAYSLLTPAQEMVAIDTTTKYERLHRHKLGTVVIPEELRAKLSLQLKGYPRASLRQNAEVLAELLRQRVRSRPSEASSGVLKPRVLLHYDRDETLTYMAHRVPGIFATAFRVLREASFKMPSFKPISMLDYGSGPGTAIWAAVTVWPETLRNAVAIEPSEWMQKASQGMLSGGVVQLAVERRRALVVEAEQRHGLVCASYSLGEIQDPVARQEEVKKLWSLVDNGGVLVLIEPGSPIGFKTILDARTTLLGLTPRQREHASVNVIAPCPHALKCPMPATSWCHYKQRTRKTPLQMETKINKVVNYSDEKYSYLVMGKGERVDETVMEGTERHRVVRQPGKKGGHVVLETCSASGQHGQITVAKSHGKEVYRSARKAFWGDEIFIDARSDVAAAEEEKPASRLVPVQKQPVKAAPAVATAAAEKTERPTKTRRTGASVKRARAKRKAAAAAVAASERGGVSAKEAATAGASVRERQ